MIQAGGALTSSYILLLLVHAAAPAPEPIKVPARLPRTREAAVLVLALLSLSLGLLPWHAYLPIYAQALSNPLTFAALSSALWPIMAGGVIAALIGRGVIRPSGIPGVVVALADRSQHAALVVTNGVMRIDDGLRQWPIAVLALLAVTVAFGIAMGTGR